MRLPTSLHSATDAVDGRVCAEQDRYASATIADVTVGEKCDHAPPRYPSDPFCTR